MKFERPIPGSRWELTLWVLIFLVLCTIFFTVDYLDTSHVGEWRGHRVAFLDWEKTYHVITHFTWAPWATIGTASSIAVFIFYYNATYVVYHHAKRNGRNVVRWVAAFLVFSPLLAGIAYLLTWPERKTKTGKLP